MKMSVFRVGQLWQAVNNDTEVLVWDKPVLLQVIGVEERLMRLVYLENPVTPTMVGWTTSFADVGITTAPNWRPVRVCKICRHAWVKDLSDPQEGFIVCWRCELKPKAIHLSTAAPGTSVATLVTTLHSTSSGVEPIFNYRILKNRG